MRSTPVVRILVLAIWLGCGPGVAGAQVNAPAPPAPLVEGPLPAPPTPLEQAVVEHACRAPGQAMLTPEAYDICLNEQLAGLRVEFGRDLQKLSAAERRTIDRACTALRTERGRDEYVACLDQRLTTLVIARGRTRPALVPDAAPAPPPVDPVAAGPAEVAAAAVSGPAAGWSSWAGLGLVGLFAAAAGGYAVWTRRRKPGLVLCRVCGELANAGDLCAACRHDLAESQRRAAAERSEQAQALADAALRAQDEADARHREAEQAAADAQRKQRETEALAQAERSREADRRREADHRRWQEAAAATLGVDDTVDPHAVLGIARDATAEQVRAAYDAALAKYAAEQVAHLGVELQDHYRRKREAVERAFGALSASTAASAPA